MKPLFSSRTTPLIHPRIAIFIFLAIAVLMVLSALIELDQSKRELFDLMEQHAHSMLETVIITSHNTMMTNELLEDFLEDRLLNNAGFVRYLFERGEVSDAVLRRFAEDNNIFRINIFNRNGEHIFRSHEQEHFGLPERYSPRETLRPIFEGETDTLIIGLRQARFQEGYRYAVAIAAPGRNAIVLNLDAEELLEFRREIGFGTLLREVTDNPDVVYIALQSEEGIIAASENVREMDRIVDSPFLSEAYSDTTYYTRTIPFEGKEVFEAVHSFYYLEYPIGLFRIGLSLDSLDAINARIYRRVIIITIVLVVIGFIVVTFIIARQNLSILQRQYAVVETYSGNIIRNVSDAIIVLDSVSGIKVYNRAAERIFKRPEQEVIGLPLTVLFDDEQCRALVASESTIQQIECTIGNRKTYLLVSKSTFTDENNTDNIIFVMKDLTEERLLQAQVERKERLSAMGELASGVAHEIRNPLNTIGTIVQQLDKDFEPLENSAEYHKLARLVYGEVKRINQTVQDFLRFARPEPLRPETFRLSDLMQHLEDQYRMHTGKHRIDYDIQTEWDGEVHWDRQQMKQVFSNLIQNAIDSQENGGKILIMVSQSTENWVDIRVHDEGPGIPDSIRAKVFNLYFTTKAKGTGIGLSIVQRIVIEHGGVVSVDSEPEKGTTFYIKLPARVG
jgi:two-component system, NtrC family, sensor histidine kinase HydH